MSTTFAASLHPASPGTISDWAPSFQMSVLRASRRDRPLVQPRACPDVAECSIARDDESGRRRADSNPGRSAGFSAPGSALARCLERCADVGCHIVITAPGDVRNFARGIGRFTERRVDPMLHARWSVAHRLFAGGEQAHDRGSWRVLAADSDGRVLGAITARFFCGEIIRDYVHLFTLVERTGAIFREECELAVMELFSTARQHNRTATEISPWSVASGDHAALVGATLTRAMLALGVGFELPLAVTAAHQDRAEFRRLNRIGGTPLGRGGRYYLPPFIHQMSGARLRLLVLDSARFGGRLLGAAADLAVLRSACPIVSAA